VSAEAASDLLPERLAASRVAMDKTSLNTSTYLQTLYHSLINRTAHSFSPRHPLPTDHPARAGFASSPSPIHGWLGLGLLSRWRSPASSAPIPAADLQVLLLLSVPGFVELAASTNLPGEGQVPVGRRRREVFELVRPRHFSSAARHGGWSSSPSAAVLSSLQRTRS
jgi:hypothetical protein